MNLLQIPKDYTMNSSFILFLPPGISKSPTIPML